ncbi:MAG: helix-turn-helix transcriptional regulator [Clostridia bacterium]|nr:helix-turn-helix transcriptional regulator [Clostridia bacterium]
MTINLAEPLRRLRTARGITQETLADFLGVSSQAVSKWERGDGLPDITMLPPLANYFGVTLDELMNMDELCNREKLAEMKKKHRELRSAGRDEEDLSLLREILRQFPNDYETMAELAEYLPDSREGLTLCRRILDFCPDNDLRSYAAYQEASLLFALDRKDEALEKTKKLPPLEYCRELNIPWLLGGEERVKRCQETIRLLGWAFFGQIEQMADETVFDAETCIALFQKAIDMYDVIYGDGNMCYTHLRVSRCYYYMGLYALDLEQFDRMAVYFAKTAEHAKLFDSLPEETTFTSLLLNRLMFERNGTSGIGTCTEEYRDWLSNKEKLKASGRYDEVLALFE